MDMAARPQDWGDGEGGQGTDDAGEDQHPLTRHPVGVHRDDRRQQGRWQESYEPDQPDRQGAAVGVGDQADRDRERPLRGESQAGGQQGAHQGAVAQEAHVHRPTFSHVPHQLRSVADSSRRPGGEGGARTHDPRIMSQ